jgi:hypothetical protein
MMRSSVAIEAAHPSLPSNEFSDVARYSTS